jgi:hypothetical protein
MNIRTIVLLLGMLQLLLSGCDLSGTTGTPAKTNNVPYASGNPYTYINDSILGIYNGLQSSNPTHGMTSGTTPG